MSAALGRPTLRSRCLRILCRDVGTASISFSLGHAGCHSKPIIVAGPRQWPASPGAGGGPPPPFFPQSRGFLNFVDMISNTSRLFRGPSCYKRSGSAGRACGRPRTSFLRLAFPRLSRRRIYHHGCQSTAVSAAVGIFAKSPSGRACPKGLKRSSCLVPQSRTTWRTPRQRCPRVFFHRHKVAGDRCAPGLGPWHATCPAIWIAPRTAGNFSCQRGFPRYRGGRWIAKVRREPIFGRQSGRFEGGNQHRHVNNPRPNTQRKAAWIRRGEVVILWAAT